MTETASSAKEQYERDGYVIFRNVLDKDLMAEANDHIDWLLERNPELRPEQLGHTLMTQDAFWVRLVSDPRLLDLAEQFIGPNIGLFASHYICKPPKSGQPVLWHQDGSYWPLEPMEVITFWLAISDSAPDNGCMRVIPGTHALDLQEMKQRTDVDSVLGSGMDDALIDASQAVDFVLEPGDVSVHHPNIIHGSEANTSDRWRRGLTIRYIPASTRILTDDPPWPAAFLLRGEAVPGVNAYNPFPKYDPASSMPFKDSENWR